MGEREKRERRRKSPAQLPNAHSSQARDICNTLLVTCVTFWVLHIAQLPRTAICSTLSTHIITEPEKSICTWFGEFCSCCCLPLLHQLDWSIHPTMYKDFFRALYITHGYMQHPLRMHQTPCSFIIMCGVRGMHSELLNVGNVTVKTDHIWLMFSVH